MIDKMLKQDEGYKTKVYWDTEGYPTIGIGHLIMRVRTKDMKVIYKELSSQVGRSITDGIITDSEAQALFAKDLQVVQSSINRHQKLYPVYNSLDNVRRNALENMVFQLGANGVAGFPSMLKALIAKDWEGAKRHGLDSLWAKQTPNRAKKVTEVLRSGSLAGYGL